MPSTEISRTVLITGANRGLGLGTAETLLRRGYRVILGVRDAKKAKSAIVSLEEEGLEPHLENLDVSDEKSCALACDRILQSFGHVDILVNNAGIFIDPQDHEKNSVFHSDTARIHEALETNTLGPLRLCKALVPFMKKNNFGRVVNISSGMGQLSEMNGGYVSYRLSKVALNAVTRMFSDELKGTNVLVNSVCPGWVKTDMGGPNATRSLEEGVRGIVWAATLPDGGPSGGFFRDGKPIGW